MCVCVLGFSAKVVVAAVIHPFPKRERIGKNASENYVLNCIGLDGDGARQVYMCVSDMEGRATGPPSLLPPSTPALFSLLLLPALVQDKRLVCTSYCTGLVHIGQVVY